jgi:hypothetical protein
LKALEHRPALAQNDGNHHDLVFIDQTIQRHLIEKRLISAWLFSFFCLPVFVELLLALPAEACESIAGL